MTRPLRDAIEGSWQGWIDDPVEVTVFGTRDPDEIARLLDDLTRSTLGAGIVGALGYHVSVGCTALVHLEDGRDVAIKVFQPHTSPEFLEAVVAVQRHVQAGGFPAPAPLLGPVAVAGTHAVIDRVLDDPWPDVGTGTTADASVRVASATALAGLIALARPLVDQRSVAALAAHPMLAGDDSLWGVPHSPLFDFDVPSPLTGTIDALGRAAKAARSTGASPVVIGHCDWTLRNIRVVDGEVVAVYDWDSLALVPETQAVGQAAQTWRASGNTHGTPWPDAEEVDTYVNDYELVRGVVFTPAERRAIGGAALYTVGYTARCEAALQARWPEHRDHPHQAIDLLLAEGDRLIA